MTMDLDDDRDWTLDELAEREPGEPEQEPPLDLDAIDAAYKASFSEARIMGPHTQDAFAAVPELVAALREAHARLARWEEVPTQEEWTVTEGGATPAADAWSYTADAAMKIAVRSDRQAWQRTVTRGPVVVQPWEPIESEPPF